MKLLVVCHGNICRSPAAHYLLKKMLMEEGLEAIQIESAGLLKEASGRGIHPKIARGLKWFGCEASSHRSVFIGDKNLEEYSYILAMDQEILYELQTEFAAEYRGKSYLFTSVSDTETELSVEDPIYTKKYWQTVRRIHHLSKQWVAFLKGEGGG